MDSGTEPHDRATTGKVVEHTLRPKGQTQDISSFCRHQHKPVLIFRKSHEFQKLIRVDADRKRTRAAIIVKIEVKDDQGAKSEVVFIHGLETLLPDQEEAV